RGARDVRRAPRRPRRGARAGCGGLRRRGSGSRLHRRLHLEDVEDRAGVAGEAFGLDAELAPPLGGQLVEARPLGAVGVRPLRGQPAALLHPVERLVERALLERENAAGALRDLLGDREAVLGSIDEAAKDEEVQSAADELARGVHDLRFLYNTAAA